MLIDNALQKNRYTIYDGEPTTVFFAPKPSYLDLLYWRWLFSLNNGNSKYHFPKTVDISYNIGKSNVALHCEYFIKVFKSPPED